MILQLTLMVINLFLQFLVRFRPVCNFSADFSSYCIQLLRMILQLTLMVINLFLQCSGPLPPGMFLRQLL